MATAIREMHVRGAGLIGASAGYGMYLAAKEAASSGSFDEHLVHAAGQLKATRPTAVNLSWAIDRQLKNIAGAKTADEKIAFALRTARLIAEEDSEQCRMIGEHGLKLIEQIADSAAGHLMQRGEVDLVIVGTDRTTYTGDVANKIGTYLKALAARDNNVPFYVALPSSSLDWSMRDGLKEIPIEERSAEEVRCVDGWLEGQQMEVRVTTEGSPAANYGFDVTPARLVTGLITERGVCEANDKSIRALFPEQAP